jgi:hypothetical protein
MLGTSGFLTLSIGILRRKEGILYTSVVYLLSAVLKALLGTYVVCLLGTYVVSLLGTYVVSLLGTYVMSLHTRALLNLFVF